MRGKLQTSPEEDRTALAMRRAGASLEAISAHFGLKYKGDSSRMIGRAKWAEQRKQQTANHSKIVEMSRRYMEAHRLG